MNFKSRPVGANHAVDLGSSTVAIAFSKMKPGQQAIIVGLDGSAHDIARLSEMGFRRGVEFIALRIGTTSIIQINFQRLCLRLTDDIVVQVQLIEPPTAPSRNS